MSTLRIIAFITVILGGEIAISIWVRSIDPVVSTQLSLAAVNGGAVENASLRAYNAATNYAWLIHVSYMVIAILIFIPLFNKKQKPE